MKIVLADNIKIIFKDEAHREFYEKYITLTGSQEDPYRKALFYLLGLTCETRTHINDLYDFKQRGIEFSGLEKAWQTHTTINICRLAFNLYNGYVGECNETETAKDYSPYNLFVGSHTCFYWQAVILLRNDL